jgi:hypothetical protein
MIKTHDRPGTMKAVKQPSRMTKQEFIQKVKNGSLLVNHVISKLAAELNTYEKKYNMRSEVFYNLIAGTPAEDTPDFINWAICYRSYFQTLQSKFSLPEIIHNVL